MFPGDALPRAARDSCDGRPPRAHASARSWSPHPGSALRGCRALGSARPASGLCPCAAFGPATAGCHLPAPSESSMLHSSHQCIRIFGLRPNFREPSEYTQVLENGANAKAGAYAMDKVLKDFFISYRGLDQPWAEWIAYQLEEA